MIRAYAKIVGISVIIIGVAGALLGNDPIFGVLNIDRAEDAIHLLTGGALVAAGFLLKDIRGVRAVVGGIGVAYLLVGLVAYASPRLFGAIPHGYDTVLDNLIHLTLGVLGIYVGFFLPDNRDSTPATPAQDDRG